MGSTGKLVQESRAAMMVQLIFSEKTLCSLKYSVLI